MPTTTTSPTTALALHPAMRPAVTHAAKLIDARVQRPSDVEGAIGRTRDEIVGALVQTTGASKAAAMVTGTAIVLAALQTLGVAWASEAIAKFEALLAA